MGIEARAREMGWVPQEEFKGNPDRWTDAETWVKNGENAIPLLRKDNENLRGEVRHLKELFQNSQEAIQALQEVHTEATKRAVEQAKKDLMAEIRAAREEGDVDLEIRLTDELTDLKLAEKTQSKVKQVQEQQQQQQQPDPDLAAWMGENTWFGKDERKTMRAMGIAQQLRSDPANDGLVGKPFYDKVDALLRGESGSPHTTKVGETRHSGNGGSGRGKTYADLPQEAKDACAKQAKRVVGEGRAYKDLPSWQAAYADIYFQGEA